MVLVRRCIVRSYKPTSAQITYVYAVVPYQVVEAPLANPTKVGSLVPNVPIAVSSSSVYGLEELRPSRLVISIRKKLYERLPPGQHEEHVDLQAFSFSILAHCSSHVKRPCMNQI